MSQELTSRSGRRIVDALVPLGAIGLLLGIAINAYWYWQDRTFNGLLRARRADAREERGRRAECGQGRAEA